MDKKNAKKFNQKTTNFTLNFTNMDKKDAKILCNLMNLKNDGYKYSLVKSAKCVNCYDLKKEKIEAKPTKKEKKNAEVEANNGVAE